MARLLEFYKKEVVPKLMEKYKYDSVMQVPRLLKISVNMGIGEGSRDIKLIDSAMDDLAMITGQRPVMTRARKSISNFKIREGMPVGCKVTLRKSRMYEFLDRFINVVLPRVRDFRGVPDNSFDGRGNYTLGVTEQSIFPEVNVDKMLKVQGMDITFVTSSDTDEEAKEFLALLGMPFRKRR